MDKVGRLSASWVILRVGRLRGSGIAHVSRK